MTLSVSFSFLLPLKMMKTCFFNKKKSLISLEKIISSVNLKCHLLRLLDEWKLIVGVILNPFFHFSSLNCHYIECHTKVNDEEKQFEMENVHKFSCRSALFSTFFLLFWDVLEFFFEKRTWNMRNHCMRKWISFSFHQRYITTKKPPLFNLIHSIFSVSSFHRVTTTTTAIHTITGSNKKATKDHEG